MEQTFILSLQNPSIHHPRASFLGLANEKITLLSANSIRATVATETNKVGTHTGITVKRQHLIVKSDLFHAFVSSRNKKLWKIVFCIKCTLSGPGNSICVIAHLLFKHDTNPFTELFALSGVLCVVQVATWVDDTLSSMASKLEHSAQAFPELQGERMVSLQCCALYTCAQLENSLYWW